MTIDVDRNKIIFIIILCILVGGLGIGAYFLGKKSAVTSKADKIINDEIISINMENYSLETERNSLTEEINGADDRIKNKSSINKEIEDYKKQAEDYKKEISDAENVIGELNDTIDKKNEYLEKMNEMRNEASEEERTLKEGTYECPDDIEEGRYIVSGTGWFLLYDSSNKLTTSENLQTLESGTYTFDLEEGGKIEIKGTVKIAPLA